MTNQPDTWEDFLKRIEAVFLAGKNQAVDYIEDRLTRLIPFMNASQLSEAELLGDYLTEARTS